MTCTILGALGRIRTCDRRIRSSSGPYSTSQVAALEPRLSVKRQHCVHVYLILFRSACGLIADCTHSSRECSTTPAAALGARA